MFLAVLTCEQHPLPIALSMVRVLLYVLVEAILGTIDGFAKTSTHIDPLLADIAKRGPI